MITMGLQRAGKVIRKSTHDLSAFELVDLTLKTLIVDSDCLPFSPGAKNGVQALQLMDELITFRSYENKYLSIVDLTLKGRAVAESGLSYEEYLTRVVSLQDNERHRSLEVEQIEHEKLVLELNELKKRVNDYDKTKWREVWNFRMSGI